MFFLEIISINGKVKGKSGNQNIEQKANPAF
jgi:hypothetical protein